MDSIADKYWLFLDSRASGGCVVYGLFGRGWVVNPSLRYPLRVLANRAIGPEDGPQSGEVVHG